MSIFKSQIKLDDTEQSFLNIIEKSVKDKNTELEYDVEQLAYLIHIPKLQYFIYLDSVGVELTNHSFFITRRIRNKVLDMYKDLVKKEISVRIQNKKAEIFKNEMSLLTKIEDKLCA